MATQPGLDEIGLSHGTDKASSHHDYLNFYERVLAPLRDQPITVLEIGVYQGASLRTWHDYFPNAKIVGVDIVAVCKRFERGRIAIELADQSNLENLAQIALRHGPFDLIVEDGSHIWEHQITTLCALFPFVKNGGFYIVEDLQTNYGGLQIKYKGVASRSCMEYLKSWMDLCVADEQIDLLTIEDPFLRTYGRSIEYMTFHRRTCVIKKKIPSDGLVCQHGGTLGPDPRRGPRRRVDRACRTARRYSWAEGVRGRGFRRFTLQGLMVQSEFASLEYRVRYPDATWSDWTAEGQFAGTRGVALPITGFATRLREGAEERFEVRNYGKFVGGAVAESGDGEDCIAPASEPLRGVQIVLAKPRPDAT